MSLKELENYTFTSKYAQWIETEKRRETWNEAFDRVKEMMHTFYKGKGIEEEIEQAYSAAKKKKVLGSQRNLQFGGKGTLSHHARSYNCCSSYIDRPRFFQECMYLLLCGCGTGFSVQKHHVAKLPNIIKRGGKKTIIKIADSIEGWSDAIGSLVYSYFDVESEVRGQEIEFDYSLIRAKGSRLSTSSGKAPGPEPLKIAITKIQKLFDECLKQNLTKLRPIHAYDMVMYLADAVVSGGHRRSATIAIFSHDDEEMAKSKTGNWFNENPQRGRSNNSALILRDEISKDQFKDLMKNVKEYGEPGFIFASNYEFLANPCVTADTVVTTYDGLSTVESLTDTKFTALVDGKPYLSSDKGFWQTGIQNIIELEFESGRKLKLTPNHQLLTTNGWKEASEIDSNDEVVINNHRSGNWRTSTENNVKWNDQDKKDYAQGYCLGHLLGDGNNSKNSSEMKWWGEDKQEYRQDGLKLLEMAGWLSNHHKNDSESESSYSCIISKKLHEFAKEKDCIEPNKTLSLKALEGNWRYLGGLVAGYFDADGTVAVNHKKGCSVRINSCNIENLRKLQIILNAFGIYSKIYQDRYPAGNRVLPDGKNGYKEYYCEATHDLTIANDSIIEFSNLIPIRNKNKIEKIQQIIKGYNRQPNRTNFTDKIINKQFLQKEIVYDCTVEKVHAFDANGVYAHNCVEISFWAYLIKDEAKYNEWLKLGKKLIEEQPEEIGLVSGWQCCNLSTINGGKIKTEEDFFEACENAAIIGTCQAGFTSFPYLGKDSEEIVRREALLGVSITGVMENPKILLCPKIQKKGAEIVKATNKKVANKIGINCAARCTCLKPEGTSSCALGTSSGIHPHHAKRYIRRVQANKLETVYQFFKKINPIACEESVWSTNDTDDVVSFCVEVRDGAKLKNQVSAIELLEYVKSTQLNWVRSGKNKELCTQPWLEHNVSNTITVKESEWDEVEAYLFKNKDIFCAVSLLPISGDKDYPQAPFTSILLPSEIFKEYGDGSLLVSGLITTGLELYDDNLWTACDALLGKTKVKGESKIYWIKRCEQFAMRYCHGSLRSLTYLMKDVYNWKHWVDLNREYKDVEYIKCIETENNVKPEDEIACAGGKCEFV